MSDDDEFLSDDDQILMIAIFCRLGDIRKDMISYQKRSTEQISELKEMARSLVDRLCPSTHHGAEAISSGSEQITRSSPSTDAQIMNLKLEEPVSNVKKLRNQMREESPKELKNQIEETQVFESVVNQDEDLKRIEMSRTPILAKEILNAIAHQVLEKMPRENASAMTYDCDELLNFDPGGEVLYSRMSRSSMWADTQMDMKLEELDQIEINEDPIVAKKHLDLGAHEVLDEMPRLMEKEIDASPKEFEVLLEDTRDQEAPPLTLKENYGSNSKVFEVCKAETELLNEFKMVNVHVRALCFDLGGGSLKPVGNSPELHCCDKELKRMLLFDPGGEAVLLDGGSHDLEAILTEKRAWQCTHVELSVNTEVFRACWPGIDVHLVDFLTPTPHKVKVSPHLKQLVLHTLVDDVTQYGIILCLEELTEYSSYKKIYVHEKYVLRMARDTLVMMNAYPEKFVFDPGGSGLELALGTWEVGVFKDHGANEFVFDPGGNWLMLLVVEPVVYLEKIGSSILEFGILDDNVKGVIIERSTLIGDNITAQLLKFSAMLDHDGELEKIIWACYNQYYVAITLGKVAIVFMIILVGRDSITLAIKILQCLSLMGIISAAGVICKEIMLDDHVMYLPIRDEFASLYLTRFGTSTKMPLQQLGGTLAVMLSLTRTAGMGQLIFSYEARLMAYAFSTILASQEIIDAYMSERARSFSLHVTGANSRVQENDCKQQLMVKIICSHLAAQFELLAELQEAWALCDFDCRKLIISWVISFYINEQVFRSKLIRESVSSEWKAFEEPVTVEMDLLVLDGADIKLISQLMMVMLKGAVVQSLLPVQLMKTHNLRIETTQDDVYFDDFCDVIPSLTWLLQAFGFAWLGITATTDHHHCISCHILFFYELVIDDP